MEWNNIESIEIISRTEGEGLSRSKWNNDTKVSVQRSSLARWRDQAAAARSSTPVTCHCASPSHCIWTADLKLRPIAFARAHLEKEMVCVDGLIRNMAGLSTLDCLAHCFTFITATPCYDVHARCVIRQFSFCPGADHSPDQFVTKEKVRRPVQEW